MIDLNTLRRRILAGEELSNEELRNAIRQLREERIVAATTAKTARTSRGSVSQEESQKSLDDFFGNLPKAKE